MISPNVKKWALRTSVAVGLLSLLSAIVAQQPRGVDAKILRAAGTSKDVLPGTWLTYGLTQTEQRYSQLKQIDESNVGKLGLAWSAPLPPATPGGRGGTEGTPALPAPSRGPDCRACLAGRPGDQSQPRSCG